jgi:hypothetical protein
MAFLFRELLEAYAPIAKSRGDLEVHEAFTMSLRKLADGGSDLPVSAMSAIYRDLIAQMPGARQLAAAS